MGLKALSDYTIYSRYAHYLPEKKRRETWHEMADRVFDMHERKYAEKLANSAELREEFNFAKEMFLKKRILGSQRSLQFAGKWIEKENLKQYNCSFSFVDRARVFSEIFYALLCGVGVGFSVQWHHINKLPSLSPVSNNIVVHKAEDSIEGWADCIGALLSSYFVSDQQFPQYYGKTVRFDFSAIRPAGSLIAGQFTAPGPSGLAASLEKVRSILNKVVDTNVECKRLLPIEAYDIIMHLSDAVLSGGIRRAATICLFSKDDDAMMNAKIGDWYIKNPQRGRSNNSVILLRNEITREEFADIFVKVKEFGEPGFVFVDDLNCGVNPCVEIGLYALTTDGRSGFALCNLSEINGKHCIDRDSFLAACRAAATLGTIQAGYTKFNYLSPETIEICEREALLGVSLTGWMENPDVLFDSEMLKAGAQVIKEVNAKVAKLLGIRPAARTTCVKPAGSSSCVLETSSGIHPHHARRYIRNVQTNQSEFAAQLYKSVNPLAVQKSAWSAFGEDLVISFACEVPKGAILKNDLRAVELLAKVKKVQEFWVKEGRNIDLCVNKSVNHNVSNTITVNSDEWDEVEQYIFNNREFFAGISLLSSSGDLDYRQAPFTTVLNEKEIVEKYGRGALFASGLIVDGLYAFDNDIYSACEAVLGVVKLADLNNEPVEPTKPLPRDFESGAKYTSALIDYSIQLNLFFQDKGSYKQLALKHDWVRRAKQFADRYFDGDVRLMTYCLKHVDLWKRYLDIKREHKEIDWSNVVEDNNKKIAADTLGAQACSGGKCEL